MFNKNNVGLIILDKTNIVYWNSYFLNSILNKKILPENLNFQNWWENQKSVF